MIAGATARFDRDWFLHLWEQGGQQFADAMSFHPYEVVNGDPSLSRPEAIGEMVQQAESDMREVSGSDTALPVWITEIGWTTTSGGIPSTNREICS